jgi:hypothetical protein
MPPNLAAELRGELEKRVLFAAACDPNRAEQSIVGGEEAETALQHFARKFVLSSARVQFVTLGHGKYFEPTSTDIRSFFQDGRVAVLDVACGSGGGLLGMLCTMAELRRLNINARLPVYLHVLAADISRTGREIHECMLRRIQADLAGAGIILTYEHMHWDANDGFSTARLMDKWLQQPNNPETYLVFVSAFGAYTERNLPLVQDAMKAILYRFHDDKQLYVAWIEPEMKGLLKWFTPVVDLFKYVFSRRGSATGHDPGVKFYWQHPFTNVKISGSARVIACERRKP